ncbi:MAG: M20/M25/M40 family metallo-hydrolase [Gammaproteobacteria bacterium]|nr:M20/M25/M40 family metallo-hydrolase [Gammaproteobacteria bacterium]
MYSLRLLITLGLLGISLAASPGAFAGKKSCESKNNNKTHKLLKCVTVDGVREHQAAFQEIADVNNGIRTSGTPGYDESVHYVEKRLKAAKYKVNVQPFQFNTFIELGASTLEQIGTVYVEETDYTLMSQTDPGDVDGLVTAVDLDLGLDNSSSSGCEAADFVGFPAGHIALIQRGACSFGLKGENAAAAGAVGAIIFNQGNSTDRLGLINGTLGSDYMGGIPVFFATYGRGVEWAGTAELELHMIADVFRGEATTFNVLAESDKSNKSDKSEKSKKSKKSKMNKVVMAGAHLDAVNAGPGIQDNGSGSAAILEVAETMARTRTRNKVRFAWWGAEESGLVGSTHYVNNLTEEEQGEIAQYLNFDMIGSPNHVFFIYDGDDSDGEGAGPGPEGSAEIEKSFEEYYTMVGEPFKGTDFSGRSDYGPFIAVGIPAGGLFTGAEGIKTDDEAAIWGGTAGDQYDPCYHLACDTYDNVNLHALDINVDAIAYSVLEFAMAKDK